jgi:hypothetical protein
VAAARREQGTSLVELLVSMVLASVIVGAAIGVLIGVAQVTRGLQITNTSSADARIAMEILTRTLRAAARPSGEPAALVRADSSGLTLYALINRSGTAQLSDPVPTRVVYGYDGTCLTETRTDGTRLVGAVPGGQMFFWGVARPPRCVLRTGTAPTFRYLRSAVLGAAGGMAAPAIGLPRGGLVDPVTLGEVASIEIRLSAWAGGPDHGIEVLGQVTLSNVLGGAVAG